MAWPTMGYDAAGERALHARETGAWWAKEAWQGKVRLRMPRDAPTM
jgi:hypothetical protein